MWPNPQETANLVTFTEEIVYGKLHFLCSESRNFGRQPLKIWSNTICLKRPVFIGSYLNTLFQMFPYLKWSPDLIFPTCLRNCIFYFVWIIFYFDLRVLYILFFLCNCTILIKFSGLFKSDMYNMLCIFCKNEVCSSQNWKKPHWKI